MSRSAPAAVALREVRPRDLPALYAMHADPEANRAGAFVPKTRAAFFKHWRKVLKNRLIVKKALLRGDRVVGYLVSFFRTGAGKPKRREVGYWIAREHWGQGLASAGLRLLLETHRYRPLFARVAETNPASRRVAEKCGFRVVKKGPYENAAGKTLDEFVLKLSR